MKLNEAQLKELKDWVARYGSKAYVGFVDNITTALCLYPYNAKVGDKMYVLPIQVVKTKGKKRVDR